MDWGGPEFVLAIIAMAMFAGVMKTAIRAKHGLPHERDGGSTLDKPKRTEDRHVYVEGARNGSRC